MFCFFLHHLDKITEELAEQLSHTTYLIRYFKIGRVHMRYFFWAILICAAGTQHMRLFIWAATNQCSYRCGLHVYLSWPWRMSPLQLNQKYVWWFFAIVFKLAVISNRFFPLLNANKSINLHAYFSSQEMTHQLGRRAILYNWIQYRISPEFDLI